MRKMTLSLTMFLALAITLAIMESKRQDEIKKAKQQATFESGGIVNTNPITDTSGEYVIQKDSIELENSLEIHHKTDGSTFIIRTNPILYGNETDTDTQQVL